MLAEAEVRIVVFGATGNVGTGLLRHLIEDRRVDEVVGVARRIPDAAHGGHVDLTDPQRRIRWVAADIATDDLDPIVAGADVVVTLAWLIQPQHDENVLYRTNVIGTHRVLAAVAREGVPAIVYASSVGAYSPGNKADLVDEAWPTDGIATNAYSRHKALVERMLDGYEREHPDTRVVRMRTSLVFGRVAASEIASLFLGPLVPRRLLGPRTIPVVPDVDRLVFQATHTDDIGAAYHLAAMHPSARGAFNIAADPVLDAGSMAAAIDARPVPLPPSVLRGVVEASWRMRLQPTSGSWIDMARQTPLMSSARARAELGWLPRTSSTDALVELLEGMRDRAGEAEPPLDRHDTAVPATVTDISERFG